MAFMMALGVFFYAAIVIDPGQSSARTGTHSESPINLIQPTLPLPTGNLGSLTSLYYTVEIHATVEGPRYTVRDSQGALLGSMLEAYEVDQVAPGLEIEGMYAEPLMLAEPRSTYPD
jgi:hypothetical protein